MPANEAAARYASSSPIPPASIPSASNPQFPHSDIQHAQDVYELATLLSIRQEDELGFERHVSRVKTYYVDYAGVLPPSKRRNLILGLNLMRLLAQNRIGEFHTELELVPADARADAHIAYALNLEQYLMEGSYSRIALERAKAPDASFGFFLDMLMLTMREKIAACAEQAYESISCEAAGKMLGIDSVAELGEFCDERGWRVVGKVIFFKPATDGVASMEQVPSVELINRSLDYARELEQII